MTTTRFSITCSIVFAGVAGLCHPDAARGNANRPYGIDKRIPWTTSRITGSPEPPPPYRIERVFPRLTFKNPLLITSAPGTDRLFVGEQAGKLYSFPRDQKCSKPDIFLDLTTELHHWDKAKVKGIDAVYGLTFHPQFAKNRYCYVCYVLNSKKEGEQLADGSRVSRFRVTESDPPRCDPASEQILITWLAGGHNGGDLKFGRDGFLYISTGDGASPNPPDVLDTGQDLSDLLSSILRIDVDRTDPGKAYAVPPDNPFLKTVGARSEIWAYGFRNPWRMSFDRANGNLWVGDVGWELWEMIYRVERGGNYGWSVMEGPQQVRPEAKRGPTPILPPTLAFPHTEAASITGGYVYHGKRLPELAGAYICGDWVTRKLWGTRWNGDKISWHRELAQGTQRIVAFGEDHDGEIYFLDYDDAGAIYQLAPNNAVKDTSASFPRKLSDSGLFASVKDFVPSPGVLPYALNAEPWADHATAERLVALPDRTTIKVYDSPVPIPGGFYSAQVFFPRDGVLAKTIFLELERGNPRSRQRVETQILHFDGTAWHGYSYEWNAEQTDALLLPAAGKDRQFSVTDSQAPGGQRKQTWHYPARAECITCHNPWAGYGLAFTLPQLDRDHDFGGLVDNQLRAFKHIGLITPPSPAGAKENGARAALKLCDPYDNRADLEQRARSYLQVNCAHCHQFGAGGTADIELRYEIPLDQTKMLEVRPVQGTFEIAGAHILSPGDPYRSILFYRVAKLGRGRMPHIGSEIIDDRGARLLHDWIRQIPLRKEERALLQKLRSLDETVLERREREEREELKGAAEAIAKAAGRTAVIPEDTQKAEVQLRARWATQSRHRKAERAAAIDKLLSSTATALLLSQAIVERRISEQVRPEIVAAAMARPEPQIRDLFERFVPEDQRVKRLGNVIKPDQILKLKGSAARGKDLFFKTAGTQCINCHRIAGAGSTLGPDLSDIGKKYGRAQILESILDPSRSIDPKYVTYLAETKDGQVHTGLLASKTDAEVVLKNVGDKEIHIPSAKLALLVPQKTSLMPELLLRDLTAEQVADLLEFLSGLTAR